MPWKPGMYLDVLTTYEDGSWEFRKFWLRGKKDNNTWQMFLISKDQKTETLYLFDVPESPGENEMPAQLTGMQPIRGAKPDPQEVARMSVWVANMFNTRLTFLHTSPNAAELSNLEKDYGLGITRVIRLEDPWPEFGYVQYHDFSNQVPILGIAGTEASDGRFTNRVVAFGTNTMGDSSRMLDHIDYGNAVETQYFDSCSMKLPASWIITNWLMPEEALAPLKEKGFSLGLISAGGDNHAVTFSLGMSALNETDRQKKCGTPDEINRSAGNGNCIVQLTRTVCDSEKKRVAELVGSICIKEDNPLRADLEQNIESVRQSMSSLRFL